MNQLFCLFVMWRKGKPIFFGCRSIYKTLDIKNLDWRENKTKVSLSFPPIQLNDLKSIDKSRDIAHNGYKTAIHLRENGKYKEHKEKFIQKENKDDVYIASIVREDGHEVIRPVHIATKTYKNRIFIIPISALPSKRSSHYVLTGYSAPFLHCESTLMTDFIQEIPPHKLMLYKGTIQLSDVDKISNILKTFF
ncbi:hypothetical protein COL27_18645 [Bacillus sp. AFS075960]|nr:hypothetical protein COL27_18645 [Bacillus sp. AFS075960]